jgi:hypothetical protein
MAAIVVEEERTVTSSAEGSTPAGGSTPSVLGGLSGGFRHEADVVILGYD